MRGEPTTLSVNDDFVDRIQNAFGEAGEAWISRLPKILEAVAERWSLSIESPFKDLFYSYIAPVLSADGEDLVLKLGVPNQALGNEIAALQAFDGRGMVKLIDSNAELGALLLERLHPGKPLTIMTDRKATSIASELIRQLQEVDAGEQAFPSVRDWGNCFERHRETFDGGAGPFSESLLTNADWLFSELNMSAGEDILLHGDLHHWNILSAERQPWLAINPKGVIGEAAYEVGAWLRNPITAIQSGGVSRNILERRVDQFVDELALERARIIGWAQSQSVLAACWALEDGDVNWKLFVGWAELLSELE